MAEFGKWTKIIPGCEIPNVGDEVLILLHDRGYPKSRWDHYNVDLGRYYEDINAYIKTPVEELGGFSTINDWAEGQDIKVVAWMPKPPAKLEG